MAESTASAAATAVKPMASVNPVMAFFTELITEPITSNAVPTPGIILASLSKFVIMSAITEPIKKIGLVKSAFPRLKTDLVKAPEPSVAPEKLSPFTFFASPLMLSAAPAKSSDPRRLWRLRKLFPALSNAGPALAPISSLKSFCASFNCSSRVFKF